MKLSFDTVLNALTVAALGVVAFAGLRDGGFVRIAWADYRRVARINEVRDSLWETLVSHPAALGVTTAPVVAVEFADYECPFCRLVGPSVDSVARSEGIAVAFLHMPGPGHKYARPAALAAICAGEQSRFPQMHHQLMSTEAWLGDTNWVREARLAGVSDLGAFGECIGSARAAGRLARDIALGKKLELAGTPTFVTSAKIWAGAEFSSAQLH